MPVIGTRRRPEVKQELRHAVIVSGPNGSGKTTIAREYLLTHNLEYLSADEIAEGLPHESLQEVRLQAGRLFFERIIENIQVGRSFLAETTLAGKGFRRIVAELKAAGYSVTLIFVFLDSADACVARIRERVRKGGHDVPEADIRRRYIRSINNFWHLYRLGADRWHLLYNSVMQAQEVAIGEGDEVVIQDENLYELFQELLRATTNE